MAGFVGSIAKDVDWLIGNGTAVQVAPDAAAPVASIASVDRAEREARVARVRDEARAHPNIQEAAKLLGADIEGTDEL